MLLTTANFILRYIHINKIKEQITNIESYISKIGLNMEIANTNFHGWNFWDLSAELNDVEIYVNSMQSVIYFKMPYIHIKSAIQNMDTLDIKIILPNIIKGRADLHEGLMQSLGFQNNKYQLLVSFPQKKKFLLTDLVGITLLSIIFTLIIIIAYSSALNQLIRQRHISEIKSDFINNMTHEFKTPIATINLALDKALLNFSKTSFKSIPCSSANSVEIP